MGKLFEGGVPTEPDVKALDEALGGKLKAGTLVLDEEIEKAASLKFGTSRYRTVTAAWRRLLLRERNIMLDRVPQVGFLVLSEKDRIAHAAGRFRGGARAVTRSAKFAALVRTDELDDVERRKADHLRAITAKAAEYLSGSGKQITAVLRAPEVLPYQQSLPTTKKDES